MSKKAAISNNRRNVFAGPTRKSNASDFIAPEAPISTHQREMDKGLKGWTDFETKVPDMGLVDGGKERAAAEEFDAMTVGTVARKVPAARKVRVVSATGPSNHYRAMQLRAAKLSVRS
ncbi:hypothetical protein SEA_GAIL_102 [Mycobacterium phage Gail]|uniref:Uncharacterized protein n=1 Tax=Mycobacterium phage Gail TaxID=2743994 RepID=A0A7D5FTJ1_9CAUD|nr:hypothetical protein KNV16_gp007 [Mycobacterium phage Gail]QLF84664.1 hypothetical protein SEA_GAIL_102 [Mycobacterium phage Gail]